MLSTLLPCYATVATKKSLCSSEFIDRVIDRANSHEALTAVRLDLGRIEDNNPPPPTTNSMPTIKVKTHVSSFKRVVETRRKPYPSPLPPTTPEQSCQNGSLMTHSH